MSNIKLKDHNWAAEGIYDTNQSKSQQTINSDVSTKIGQATLQTSSQNLSGATNELKGRADTLDSKYDNVVTVANTQPSSQYNKVWLPLTVSEGTQVPTWAEHQALESSLNGAITSIEEDLTPIKATGTTNTTGAKIDKGQYFYLNGTLVVAKTDIASGATFTSGTNYKIVTTGVLPKIGWAEGFATRDTTNTTEANIYYREQDDMVFIGGSFKPSSSAVRFSTIATNLPTAGINAFVLGYDLTTSDVFYMAILENTQYIRTQIDISSRAGHDIAIVGSIYPKKVII